MRAAKCTFLEAAEWLLRDYGGDAAPPRHRQRYENADRWRRTTNSAAALEIWRVARPIPGTPAERYLSSRGIEGGLPASLRYGRAPAWIDPATGEARSIRPALIAACQDVDGRIVGIHRTFLSEAGAKAPMEQPRLALGQIRGGALRLGPERRDLMLCEGIEDGLSLTRMFVGATVWVALGAGNMPHVRLPATVRRVIVAGDADGPGVAAADAAVAAFHEQGREAATILPKGGARDFNEDWAGRK